MDSAIPAFYVDRDLSVSEIAEIQDLTGLTVATSRLPFVLPVLSTPASKDQMEKLESAIERALRSAGLLRYGGQQVMFVAMVENWLGIRFTDAIYRLTGVMPYLVQTTVQRDAIGNPGELRVLNLDAGMDL